MVGFELQQAIDNILTGDTDLLAMLADGVNSITDNPSEQDSTSFPFIRYDELQQAPFFDKTVNGADVSFQISVFSRSGNKQEANNILKRVYALLHTADITIQNYNVIHCLWNGTSKIMIDDTMEFLLFHGIIQFNILLEEE